MAETSGRCETDVPSPPQEWISETTLLELLTQQQTRGEKGIRLAFQNSLAQRTALSKDPFMYCAMTGNTALAVYLYQHGAQKSHPIRIASFTSDGAAGVTPWKKALKIPAPVAARMAGHASTAEALDNMERGTPLHWTRDNAHQWPENFTAQLRPLIEACSRSPWFLAFPGPVRLRIIECEAEMLARKMYWSRLGQSAWQQDWDQVLAPGLLEAASQVLKEPSPSTSKRSSSEDQDPQFPSYQIRITGEPIPPPRPPSRGLLSHIARGAAGCLAVKIARQMGVGRILPEGVMVFALGCAFPAPVMMIAALLIKG